MPEPLLIRGMVYKPRFEICVDTRGNVEKVNLTRASAAALDAVYQETLKTWKYRPLLVGGEPAPFCHPIVFVVTPFTE